MSRRDPVSNVEITSAPGMSVPPLRYPQTGALPTCVHPAPSGAQALAVAL